jgi:hypothetical protein
MLPGLAKLSYEERLMKLGISSLSYKRFRGDMIEVYKCLHGLYCIDCSDIIPLHRNEGVVTRGHSLKLEKRGHYSQSRANFFGFRVVNAWNSLPDDTVSASSVNCLKGRFDRLYQGLSCSEV